MGSSEVSKLENHNDRKYIKPNRHKLHLTVDPASSMIFIISLATRFYKLGEPRSVVFDELHYVKFISLYLKRVFFFDPQPPFGKQLMAIIARLVGFEGDLSYSQIGDPYRVDVPIYALRLLPCISGSLIPPICYLIGLELGLRQVTAALVSTLIIFENAYVTQSRFILLDSILMLFSTLAIYGYLKYRGDRSMSWLIFASLNAALACCTRYSGLYSYGLLIGLVCYDWWTLLDERIDIKVLLRKSLLIALSVIVLPTAIYVLVHYAHLAWLIRAGPHDSIMTSAFQASLENGLASITRGQPLEISHGSQITLRHTHGRSCWLHSHEHLYPVKYPDGRGSSHQQQVTCYSFKDVNNWWIVKRPDIEELVVTEPFDRIKDGDLIQLVHGMTGRTLNSHDVASAMSPYSQEVSCYVDHNISMPAQNLWQVRLNNPLETNGHWHTLNSRLQLLHFNSSLALRFSGRQLPDWGFHQHEVVADKELRNDDTIWNVEEHRHTKSEDQRERELQLGQAEFVPLEPTILTFFEKFYELHYKLLSYNQDAVRDHIYACESPIDWILMNKGTAYWVNSSSNESAQIFLIGNVSNNLFGLVSVGVFLSFILFYILRRRRQIFSDLDEHVWSKLELQAVVLMSGYLVNLIPYFAYESPLFLQYYLSAMMYKLLLIGSTVDHLYQISPKTYIIHAAAIFVISRSVGTFVKLSPLTYGLPLSREQVESLRWRETWQLINVNSA